MKITFNLNTELKHFQSPKGADVEIVFDWKYDVLPRKGDFIDIEDMINEEIYPDNFNGLSWKLDWINWQFKDGEIIAVLYLDGC